MDSVEAWRRQRLRTGLAVCWWGLLIHAASPLLSWLLERAIGLRQGRPGMLPPSLQTLPMFLGIGVEGVGCLLTHAAGPLRRKAAIDLAACVLGVWWFAQDLNLPGPGAAGRALAYCLTLCSPWFLFAYLAASFAADQQPRRAAQSLWAGYATILMATVGVTGMIGALLMNLPPGWPANAAKAEVSLGAMWTFAAAVVALALLRRWRTRLDT